MIKNIFWGEAGHFYWGEGGNFYPSNTIARTLPFLLINTVGGLRTQTMLVKRVGWVGEIKYGLTANARGGFTS